MSSIFKIAYKNMFSKKGRSFMLILSVVLSAGLVYSVLNLTLFTKDIFINGFAKEYGSSNILLYKEDYSFFSENIDLDSDYDYMLETNNLVGYTEFDSKYVVKMQSHTMNEFNEIYDSNYIEKLDVEFNSNYILIGEKNSEEFGLDINDSISLSFNGNEYNLIIYGIVEEGATYLDQSSNTLDVVITKDFVENTLGILSPNMIHIKSDDDAIINELDVKYSGFIITDLYNQEEVISSMQTVTVPLFMMAGCVVLVSSFVIYSTYKIVVLERLPLLGTLRSVGATKKFSNKVLLLESTLYGLFGGIIGIGFGMLFLTGLFNLFFENSDLASIDISYFNILYAVLTILLSIVLSVVSSVLPVIKTSQYSIKAIMFSEIKNTTKSGYKAPIIGITMIVVAFILAETSNFENDLIISLSTMLIAIVGSILTISLLIKLLSPIVQKILQPIFKNKADISIKNIKNDKTLINNIVLLAVGLGLIFMINNLSTSVSKIVVEVYDKGRFDLTAITVNVDEDFINDVMLIDGVDNVYSTKTAYNIETSEGFDLQYVNGIEINGYNTYAWGEYEGLITPELLNEFTGNSIIMSQFNAEKYGLDIGDDITLLINEEEYTLELIKTIPSVLNNGNNSFINIDLFTELFEINEYQNIYIDVSGNIDEIKNSIKELYIYGVLPIDSLEEMEENNQDNNAMLFVLLRGISFLAMLIGSIGIINNFMVSFISRRKLIASLRSLGLSKRGTVKLFMIESLAAGVIGSTIGVMLGILFFKFMGYVISAINIAPEMLSYNIKEMIFIFISGIVLSVTAALMPAIHMSKQNIVKEIKYE